MSIKETEAREEQRTNREHGVMETQNVDNTERRSGQQQRSNQKTSKRQFKTWKGGALSSFSVESSCGWMSWVEERI